MDGTPVSEAAAASPQSESKTQEAARLRRERRNAKIQAGGSARLNKITSLSGRPAAAEAELTKTRPPQQQQPVRRPAAEDPEEVDITTMFQRPPPPDPQSQDDFLRQLLANSGGPPLQGGSGQPPDALEDDPIMRMMQQMMGGSSDPTGGGGLPPGLASMFGGAQSQPEPESAQTYIWRIVHGVFAVLLAIYAVSTVTFTSSSLARTQALHLGESVPPRVFWIFSTAELVLQSSRYFIDGGRMPASGFLGGLGAMLPEPWGGYVRVVLRYSVIYTTIVSDAMVVVFVMGWVAWWKGLVAR